ncbi:hypothetical protein F511_31317 [Dorcoceras hygrometricum]|uniref:Delphilin-like n=1 Tax=Dorcoceras hygrometricum TaxID=472368 RepID=A0A2Z7D5I6_9LAMI|nr:hypothetical protein F511_31317 [Dorcoceras hygrometricum]
MKNSSAYVSATVGHCSTKKTALLTSSSSHMFRGNNDACVSATVAILTIKKTALLTSFYLIVLKGNRSAYVAEESKGLCCANRCIIEGYSYYTMGDGVPFPSSKILSMRTVHTYIVTNTTIDARAESEEPGMAKTPKAKKKTSSVDEMPVDIFTKFTASKNRSATEADAPIITKKRRTRKSKPSVSQVNLDIVHVAPNVEPLQIVVPTHDVAPVPSPVLKRKSRKRRLVLSGGSDDESVGTEEIVKDANVAAVASTDEADIIIAKVLEETLELGVSAIAQEGTFEPEIVGTRFDTQAEGSICSVAGKEVNISAVRKQVTEESMPIDDLLIQISDDLLLPITTAEVTMIRLGAFSSSGDKGKAKLVEDEQVTENHARSSTGMLNMFKALEASGLRRFLGCESVLYEKELGHFFDTALIQDEDITGVISGKFVSISPTLFANVFDLPTEGISNFSEVPKDKVYDARSFFSQKGVQIDVHGTKKYMKHEFRLLNDILAKAITVKAGSFDSVTVERFRMMTVIHYGLNVNWGKVLFNVLKDMVDRSQRKAKGFAAQIGVLLKGIPTITMGDGVPFPSAKILSMRTVHTYIVTNTTIDARAESEEHGMAKTPKAKKKTSSVDEMPVDIVTEFTASKKRSATEADAPIITKKRRTGKSKPSVSQVNLDIVQVTPDVEPLQIFDPTHDVPSVPSPVLKQKSRKRRLVLSRGSDDESMGTKEIVKDADAAAVASTDEADIIIAKVLEETLELGVSATAQEERAICIDKLTRQILKQYYLSLVTPDFATVLFLETVQVTFTIDSFRKQLVQHDIVCFNRFDDVSHSRHHDVTIIFSYEVLNRNDDVSSAEICKWIDMMTSSVLKIANG